MAVFLALVALSLALGAFWMPHRTLRKAFRALERDVDDQWEKIDSHMGRVSRLKRSMMSLETTEPAKLAIGGVAPTPASRPQTRANLMARWRKVHS